MDLTRIKAKLVDVFAEEVISTGLPYLIVPVTGGIDRARVCSSNAETCIRSPPSILQANS